MAYQTLECDRRGGLAARERREELSDPVPVLCDPIEVDRNLLAYKFARFWALPWMEEPATRWPPTKNPEEPDNEGVAQSIADSSYTPLSVPVPF